MKFIVISGRSGSGKSTALAVLEDCGFNCIDNLPISLMPALIDHASTHPTEDTPGIAICIDARNLYGEMTDLPDMLESIPKHFDFSLVYMDADNQNLLSRFSETRRKHPLSNSVTALAEALEAETQLLSPLSQLAHITINTSDMRYHDLRDYIMRTIAERNTQQMAVLFQSFGYKYGMPHNADLVFDVRCLPNPHWEPRLKDLPGTDNAVADYILKHPESQQLLDDLDEFLAKWLPAYNATNRQYTTVAIGCTGGRHRSVCIARELTERLKKRYNNTVVRHRDIHHADRKYSPSD